MNNYEYIIASLPLIKLDERAGGSVDASCVIEEIRSQLSDRDDRMMELLLESYNPDKLDASIYRRAFKSPSSFLRSHFLCDLQLRNTRVEYLNAALGRPEGKDTLILEELEDRDFEQKEEVEAVLAGNDIIARERGLDLLMWNHIEESTVHDFFDIDAILAFTAKLKIIDRWDKLDPQTGAELFRRMVTDIRATYDNKKQK